MKLDEKLIKYIKQLDEDTENIREDILNKTKKSDIQLLTDIQDDLKEILGGNVDG